MAPILELVAADPGSSPAQWWEVLGALGPLAVLLAAAAAAVVGALTLRQRTRADALTLAQTRLANDRSEWWTRAAWALDRALDDRPSIKALGLSTLEVLARSPLAHAQELELFDVAWAAMPSPSGSAGVDAAKPDNSERRARIAAARLRTTVDGRLGRATPEEVKSLAGQEG